MKVTVIPGNRLSGEHVAVWSKMQRANRELDSPYFRPEFVQAVAEFRKEVAVGILEEHGRIVGFFPFQRGWWGIGGPVGGPLSDFHGIVAWPETRWNAKELVAACGLAAWRFDHLVATQEPFRAYHRDETPSPFLDLSEGFEAYQEQRKRSGSRVIAEIARRTRAAQRDLGPLRFEFHSTGDEVFETLLRWKSEQYRRTGFTDVLAFPWVVQLLDQIRHRQDEAFGGVLSALYLGNHLAAAHLGMRSYDVLHYWFPVYNVELGSYSPGMLLLLETARAGAACGVRRLDLGKGLERHKTRLMSGALPVAEGSVDCRPRARRLEEVRRVAHRLARLRALGVPVRWALRASRPLRRWIVYR